MESDRTFRGVEGFRKLIEAPSVSHREQLPSKCKRRASTQETAQSTRIHSDLAAAVGKANTDGTEGVGGGDGSESASGYMVRLLVA